MKTRYRIIYNGEIYKVQEMVVRKFFFKLKRYWKDTKINVCYYGECGVEKIEKVDKEEAIRIVETLKLQNIKEHQHRLHMKYFKLENPSGWKKVWP